MKMIPCGRCGKSFDEDDRLESVVLLLNRDMPGDTSCLRPVSLCPYCQASAVRWFRALVDRALMDSIGQSLGSVSTPLYPVQERDQSQQRRHQGENEQGG